MKKLIVVLILLMAFAGTVMGQADLSQFPDPVEPGNFLLSIGAGIGGVNLTTSYGGASMTAESFAIGGLVKADYALPIPLTLGIEGGVIAATGFKYEGYDLDISGVMIPILARVGWHPNFGVSGLDPYIAGKAGVGILSAKGISASDTEFCFGFGGDIGARYFFTPMFGVFLEGDFDVFFPTSDTGGTKVSLFAPSVVVGITLKF